MEQYDIYAGVSAYPSNHDDTLSDIDITKLWERGKPPGPSKSKPPGSWEKETNVNRDMEEAEPEWIDFDPEKQTKRFLGNEMADEARLREEAKATKIRKEKMAAEKKEKAI